MAHILEAICGKCEETFNPADTQDIIHMLKEDGNFCGGTGDIQGEYHNLPTFGFEPPLRSNVVQLLTGDEGGWCGDITEHSPHGECEGS